MFCKKLLLTQLSKSLAKFTDRTWTETTAQAILKKHPEYIFSKARNGDLISCRHNITTSFRCQGKKESE